MSVKIFLPVRAHVKKYLEHTHGSILEVSSRGYAPLLLLLMLERHKKQDPATIKPSQKLIDGKNFFGYPIYVGDNIENYRGTYISRSNIKLFNEAIDDLFKEEMYRYINHINRIDDVVDYNILRFREIYGISEDELTFDNLKRWYYRERQRLEERLNQEPPFTPQLNLFL